MSTYRAIVTQAGNAAPTANVRQNDTGLSVAWSRVAQGRYNAVFSGLVLPATTEIYCKSAKAEDPTNYFNTIDAFVIDDVSNAIEVVTGKYSVDGGWNYSGLEDDILKNWSIEVRL